MRGRLRAETRDAHDRVDLAFSSYPLSERDGYGAFLQAHAAVLPQLESAIDRRAPSLLPDWAQRRRTAALLSDLERLGLPAAPGGAAPHFARSEQVLGALYVLEGSRLGSRLLLAKLQASPDPTVRSTGAYLGHGEGQRFWPGFLTRLEACTGDPQAVVEGALLAFGAFEAAAAGRGR